MQVDGFDPIQSFNIEWLKNGIGDKDFVDFSDKFGDYLANLKKDKRSNSYTFKSISRGEAKFYKDENLTNSQFRNLFSMIKTIEMKKLKDESSKTKLFMIRPLLEYSYRRKSTKAFEIFKEIVIKMLNEIYLAEDALVQEKYFKNFSRIIEATLAYHKAHGGN